MKVGVIISQREADIIRKRLLTIGRLAESRRISEQCRMICSTINKGERRAAKNHAHLEKE